ncbi:unnamed protein product [Tenebrio molitor]|nr:unnamed protein product [Tenebrio molitor]
MATLKVDTYIYVPKSITRLFNFTVFCKVFHQNYKKLCKNCEKYNKLEQKPE